MSHTTKIGPYSFTHDGDWRDGIVEIVNTSGTKFRVMGSVLRAFVVEQVRQERIAKLERASHDEIFGLK